MGAWTLAVSFLALSFVHNCYGFYLPGVSPIAFKTNEEVPLWVNKIESTHTQLTFSYYDLPFCKPSEANIVKESENIGQVLSGDMLTSSLYQLKTKTNEYCKLLCRRTYSSEEGSEFASKIADDYTVDWVLDNLPAAVRLYSDTRELYYQREFSLGFQHNDAKYLYNHIRFNIKHNPSENPAGTHIVGFEVEPFSVKHEYEGTWSDNSPPQLDTCKDGEPVTHTMSHQRIDLGGEVLFTYDVHWQESSDAWATRWQIYNKLVNQDEEIHWLSVVNSILIVLFLTCMIAMILMRSLYRDIAAYNKEQTLEEQSEETGWKLVHGDVFRAPTGLLGPMTLAVCVGTGIQLMVTALVVLLFMCLGFLSPSYRGSIVTAMIALYTLLGSVAGYASSRVYKMYKGEAWKRNTVFTSLAFPAFVSSLAFFINLFVWGKGSSLAIPFLTMLGLAFGWLCIYVPLCFAGSFFGFKKDTIQLPVRTNPLPRHIPPQPWYLTGLPVVLIGGVLPFGAMFIELFFVMSSIWLHQTYVLYGFLMLVMVIVLITCAEISIVLTYLQLCSEDWKWSWRSIVTPGASAGYLFVYSIVYYSTKLEISTFTASVMYFGYMAMIAVLIFLITGSVGFAACLFFVRKIYGAIKVD